MKIEQQLVRDQLAVELVKEIGCFHGDPAVAVDRAFAIADLTVKRMADDLQKLIDEDEKRAVEDALVKAELQAAEARDFEERRKGGGINVIETDDVREVLALLRAAMRGE